MSKYEFTDKVVAISPNNPSVQIDLSKCIKCTKCKKTCHNDMSVDGFYDLEKTGDEPICINCGQCAVICPVNAITEVPERELAKKAIADKSKIVIFTTAPAVRVGLGEEFGLEFGTNVEDKMVSALRELGGDYVLDTTFGADITITEEASELASRMMTPNSVIPQFTSCCPAWVKYLETYRPDLIPNLSSAKSPISMQGAVIKTYFAEKMEINPENIVNIAITPCTAKKYEIRREEMNASAKKNNSPNMRDTDLVITTRELAEWIREENIDFNALKPSQFDKLMARGSGAGIIFGNTGGVMEAAARSAHYYITGENAPKDFFKLTPVRGLDGIKEAKLTIGSREINVAAAHTISNAKNLLEKIKSGEMHYDFIEVMACRGGCIGGGGQPKTRLGISDDAREKRIASLYKSDDAQIKRSSHENPDIIRVYKEYFDKPLSHIAEEMLHTTYTSKSHTLGE